MPAATHPLHCRVVISGDDVWEDVTTAASQLQAIATASGMVTAVQCGLARLLDNPAPDIAILYTAVGQFTPRDQRRLAAMVEAGMGVLALHTTAVFPGLEGEAPDAAAQRYWAAAFALLGVRYDSHGPHPHETRFTVRLDASHPITTGLSDFPLTHEHYHLVLADPAPQVLAWRDIPGGREPLLTVRYQGAGRVAYLQLGHDMRAFGEPTVRQLMARCLTWCATPTPPAPTERS